MILSTTVKTALKDHHGPSFLKDDSRSTAGHGHTYNHTCTYISI